MKMEDMSLKDVEVGTSVWSPVHGYGRIKLYRGANSVSDYPVIIDFTKEGEDVVEVSYTYSGKEYKSDVYPTVFFGIPNYEKETCPKKPRWRAKFNQGYYSISGIGKINSFNDTRDFIDNLLYENGNYFKNKEIIKESELYQLLRPKESEQD